MMLTIHWFQRYDPAGENAISGFTKSVDLYDDSLYGRLLAEKVAQVTESDVRVYEVSVHLDHIFQDAAVHNATKLLELVRHLRAQQEQYYYFHAFGFDQMPGNAVYGRDLLKQIDQFEEAIKVIDPDKHMAALRAAAVERRAIVLADRNKETT